MARLAKKATKKRRPPSPDGPLSDDAIKKVFDALAKKIDPRSDLEFSSPFELLVAVVLSAQATDKSVNLATRRLYPVANTPATIKALGIDGLTPYVRHIGLFNSKAKNVIALCGDLLTKHNGEVPRDRESLQALPGVGRKTANVVLNVAFGEPTIAVDTHVHRIANRLGIARTTTPEKTELVLMRRVPAKHMLHAHHFLILHGRYTCKARKAECWRCPVSAWCLFVPKTPDPDAK
jgi:endonuclease-3